MLRLNSLSLNANSIESMSWAVGDDNTVTRMIHDETVLRLQKEDDDNSGDGGTSDAEGLWFECCDGFVLEMNCASRDCKLNDNDEIEDNIVGDTDETSCPVNASIATADTLTACMVLQKVGNLHLFQKIGLHQIGR